MSRRNPSSELSSPVYPDTPGNFVQMPDGSIVPEDQAPPTPPQLPPASPEVTP
jgi:hypothetical protein